MKNLFAFCLSVFLFASGVMAGDAITWTVNVGTNNSGSAFSNPFTGEIDEIAVYAIGNTGAVSIVAIDPFSSTALVLATNATAKTYTVWTPRIMQAAIGGATALSVTNLPSADRYRMQGESLKFTVGGTTGTGTVFRARIKTK